MVFNPRIKWDDPPSSPYKTMICFVGGSLSSVDLVSFFGATSFGRPAMICLMDKLVILTQCISEQYQHNFKGKPLEKVKMKNKC